MTTTQQKNHTPADGATQKKATLYRMVMDKHTCPYGIKSKDLLEREGYVVDDHHLTTREATDAFREEHDVKNHASDLDRWRACWGLRRPAWAFRSKRDV